MDNSTMPKQLFFVCPISRMETFVTENYGNVFFITAPASIFRFDDKVYTRELRNFILREDINEIVFVSDLDCVFVNNALIGNKPFGLPCENIIDILMTDGDDNYTLCEKILLYQMQKIRECEGLREALIANSVVLKGLLTQRATNTIQHLDLAAKA